MRTVARIDSNHSAIVDALRKCGCSVQSLAQLGGGVPDLLVAVAGQTFLCEVKALNGKLTAPQKAFHAAWKGRVVILYSVEQALDLVSFMKGRLRRPAAA